MRRLVTFSKWRLDERYDQLANIYLSSGVHIEQLNAANPIPPIIWHLRYPCGNSFQNDRICTVLSGVVGKEGYFTTSQGVLGWFDLEPMEPTPAQIYQLIEA